jgi:copper chaperone CopZ
MNASNDLGLTDASSGCSCSPAGHAETRAADEQEGLVTAEYLVTGMTCSHCVASVTEELSAIDGVDGVQVDLHVGGESRVSVSSTAPIDSDAVRAAVEEAGYLLVTAD